MYYKLNYYNYSISPITVDAQHFPLAIDEINHTIYICIHIYSELAAIYAFFAVSLCLTPNNCFIHQRECVQDHWVDIETFSLMMQTNPFTVQYIVLMQSLLSTVISL